MRINKSGVDRTIRAVAGVIMVVWAVTVPTLCIGWAG